MPRKRQDNPSMVSFRLSAEAQGLLEQAADVMSRVGPVTVSKTDMVEIAVREWCKKNLEKFRNRLDVVNTKE